MNGESIEHASQDADDEIYIVDASQISLSLKKNAEEYLSRLGRCFPKYTFGKLSYQSASDNNTNFVTIHGENSDGYEITALLREEGENTYFILEISHNQSTKSLVYFEITEDELRSMTDEVMSEYQKKAIQKYLEIGADSVSSENTRNESAKKFLGILGNQD